jgi:hypothetical protein
VRDTIARQSDVDASSIKYEVEPGKKRYAIGTITFAAKKGKSLDLQKLQESIRATRLGGDTNSEVKFLEITAEGEVVGNDKETLLSVSGTKQQFRLGEDPQAKPKDGDKTPYQRLQQALAKGQKVASVTSRVQGWSGRWPVVLRELAAESAKDARQSDKAVPKKPTLLLVTAFETAP